MSRLILVAEKDKVYEKFPIPLINRLEKHVVTTTTMLEPCQEGILRDFQIWIKRFTSVEKGYVYLTLFRVKKVLCKYTFVHIHDIVLYQLQEYYHRNAYTNTSALTSILYFRSFCVHMCSEAHVIVNSMRKRALMKS